MKSLFPIINGGMVLSLILVLFGAPSIAQDVAVDAAAQQAPAPGSAAQTVPAAAAAEAPVAGGDDATTNIVQNIAQQMQALARDLSAKRQAYAELQGQFAVVQREYTATVEQLSATQRQLKEKEDEFRFLKEQHDSFSKLLAQAQAEIESLKQKSEQVGTLKENYEKRLSEFDQKLATQTREIQVEREQVALERQNTAKKIMQYEEQLLQKERALGEKVKELQQAQDLAQKQVANREQEAQELREKNTSLLQEKERYLNMLKGYETQLTAADQKSALLQQELEKQKFTANEQLTAAQREAQLKLKERDEQALQNQERHASALQEYKKMLEDKDKLLLTAQEELRKKDETYAVKFVEKEKALQDELAQARRDSAQQLQALSDKLQAESRQNAERLKEYESLLKEKDGQLSSLRQAVEQRGKLLIELSGEEKQQEVLAQLKKLKEQNEQLTGKNNRLVEEKLQLMARMVRVEDRAASPGTVPASGDAPAVPALAKDDFEYVRSELSGMQETVKQLRAEYEALKRDHDALKQEKLQFTGVVEDYKQKLAATERQLQAAGEQMTAQEKDYIVKLERNQQDLTKQLKEFRDLAGELQKKNELFNKDKELYLSQIDDLKKRYSGLEVKLKTAESDRDTLTKRVKDLYKTERKWQGKDSEQLKLLADYAQKIDVLNEEIGKLRNENQRLSLDIKTMPDKLAKLENENESLRMQNATLHYNLGVFHTQRQEYMQAIEEFQQCLKFNSAESSAHYNLGIIYSRYIIDEPKAVLHFKHYLSLTPNDKDAQRAKEYVLLWGAKDDVK